MKKALLMLMILMVSGGCVFAETPVQEATKVDVQKIDIQSEQVENVKLLNLVNTIGTLVIDERYDEAMEKCEEALKIYPNEPDLYYWRASILSDKNKHLEALADYEKAIALSPKDLNYRLKRAMCMHDLGNRTGALDELDYIFTINSQYGSAYALRAVLRMEMGDYSGANSDLELANKYFDEEIKEFNKELEETEAKTAE